MTNTKHTPTPWASLEKDDYNRVCIVDGNGHSICICNSNNADLIVRAVNNHQPLIEALEKLSQQKIEDEIQFPNECDFEGAYTECVKVARAALKLAKEG